MTAMHRRARALLAVLAAVLAGVLVVPAATATAAPATAGTAPATAEITATDVFAGIIVRRLPRSGGTQVPLYRVRVGEVIKGELQEQQQVVLAGRSAFLSCDGASLVPSSTRVLLFQVTAVQGVVVATRCPDIQPATPLLLREVRQQVQAEEEEANPPAPAPELPEVVFDDVADGEPRPFARSAAPGLAVVIVGLLGLFLTRRLNRRR